MKVAVVTVVVVDVVVVVVVVVHKGTNRQYANVYTSAKACNKRLMKSSMRFTSVLTNTLTIFSCKRIVLGLGVIQ